MQEFQESIENEVETLISQCDGINGKDEYGRLPLSITNRKEVAERLISKGANVNATNMLGKTPLHYAVMRGKKDIVKVLITKGANPNIKDKLFGLTPLHKVNNKEIAEMLIKNGADINAKDTENMTPLDMAIDDDIRILLCKYGAKPGTEIIID